jgi:peptidyl-dipeptidase Dcp
MSADILLAPWCGPYGGVPPLDRVQIDDFAPAIRAAIEEKRAEARALRDDPAEPTFDNTMLPLQRMGDTLSRVLAIYYLWGANFSSPELRAIQRELAPELSKLRDDIRQDPTLFRRVQAVAQQPLNAEQQRLVDECLHDYRTAGAHLDQATRDRVAQINQRLSTLYTQFNENLLADEENYVTFLSADQLGGLPDSYLAGAKAAAEALGRPDAWAVTNTRSSMDPFLIHSTERALREKVWRDYYGRCDHADEHDNHELISEVLALRTERAKLLGFDNHAELVLSRNMAKTPAAALDLMKQIWDAAATKLDAEIAELSALADAEDAIELAPWDLRFYAERLRKQRYAFDASELQSHFSLDRLRDGMFWAAEQCYGWRFEPADDVPLPHPDFSVYRVLRADGSVRGLFYFDPYARKGKRSGAWMTAYRSQSAMDGDVLPLVSNNCNFTKAPAGSPTLLSLDEAETLFHEFGHALHGLASQVTYRGLAGTAVARDFVEFPSQLNEHWLTTPELMKRFALHHATGAEPDPTLLERLEAAKAADAGFRTMEFMASAVVDMELHLRTDPVDTRAAEQEILQRWGLSDKVVMRHRTPQFSHLFSGESYSAGYYSYLWADALVADAADAFAEKSFYDAELCERLMNEVLSRGNTVDPAQAFRAFRGRDPEVAPLLRQRGLA